MHSQRLLGLMVVLLLFTLPVAGQAKKQTSKNSPIPYLVGISVADVDASVKWYEENLGFKTIKRMELPQYDLRLAFLELNGFRVELIENKKSFSIKKYVPDYQDGSGLLQGMAKVGFLVNKIDPIAESLKKRGVPFVVELREDKEFAVKFFIIQDNSGNLIQYFQKLKP
jgi:catechol 2,3-dioxygenase-like lactoylglutathione lyase family enzyme